MQGCKYCSLQYRSCLKVTQDTRWVTLKQHGLQSWWGLLLSQKPVSIYTAAISRVILCKLMPRWLGFTILILCLMHFQHLQLNHFMACHVLGYTNLSLTGLFSAASTIGPSAWHFDQLSGASSCTAEQPVLLVDWCSWCYGAGTLHHYQLGEECDWECRYYFVFCDLPLVFCQQGCPCHHVWLFRSVVKLVNLSTSLLWSDSMLEISGPSKY